MSGGGRFAGRGPGLGVGRNSIGRAGVVLVFRFVPARGPGDPSPFGPGLGAVPRVFATAAASVGLGLGTPDRGAGGADERTAGAGEGFGAALARATTVAALGLGLGAAGAGLARVVGAEVGAGGFARKTVATAVGTGDGAALGGSLIATATGATVGTLWGAAGNSLVGWTS